MVVPCPGKRYFFGTDKHFGNIFEGSHDTLFFLPTVLGSNLYLWTHGQGHLLASEFSDPNTIFPSSVYIPILLPVKSVNFVEAKTLLLDIEVYNVQMQS